MNIAAAEMPIDLREEQLLELSALYQLTDRLYRARSADDVYQAALTPLLIPSAANVLPFCFLILKA